MTTPRSRLAGATAYSRPAPRRAGLLRLDGNEGARPPASLLEGLATGDPELLRLYPDTAALEARLADRGPTGAGFDPRHFHHQFGRPHQQRQART